MSFSISPSVQVNEIDLSSGIANLPSAKTGMILCCDTGPCNQITAITNESDLINKFGKPTTGNYKDWFNAWNFLQYSSSLFIARPTNIDIASGTQNSGVRIIGNSLPVSTGLNNLYNQTIAELTLQNDSIFGNNTLYFYNKNITSNQDLAISVCSTSDYFSKSLSNEYFGVASFDGSNWATVNNFGGFSGNTPTQNITLQSGSTIVPTSKFIANEKLFTVRSKVGNIITLSSLIYPSDLAQYSGSAIGETTVVNNATSFNCTFNLACTLNVGSVVSLGGIVWYVSSITNSDTLHFTPVPGNYGTQIAFTLHYGDVLYSNSTYLHLKLSPTYLDEFDTNYTVPNYTQEISVESDFTFNVGSTLKFTVDNEINPTSFTGLVADTIAGETSNYTYTVINVDTIHNKITLDKALAFSLVVPYDISNHGLLYDVITSTPTIHGISNYSLVFDDSLILKTNRNVTNTETDLPVVISVESLVKFSNFVEYAPNWENGEFLTIILKKNTLGKYAFVEKQIASYNETARDIQNRNIFADNIFLNSSNYVYCKVGGVSSLVNTGDYSTVKFSNIATIGNAIGSVYPSKPDGITYDPNGYSKSDIQTAFNLFADAESFDINILIAHNTDINFASSIAETRKDCVAIVSPYAYETLVSKTASDATNTLLTKYGSQYPISTDGFNTFGTYSAIYGNMKYQYDKFNDMNRWMCLAGDIAGIYAYTDNVRDPWYAPAGLERGKIKNAIKIAFNANKQNRDELYINSINPIISVQGEGVAVVYGQKTATAKPSALDRINVRRLLITIEKAMSNSVRYSLFEFNDSFTRARLVGMIEPYLRTVKSRRGIYDFLVVCDETNNPASIIDANALVIDVFIKPSRVAEFIKLNVILTRSDASFQELVGSVGV